ncbi:MAG: iron-containing alcohol dehydrogenase family protein [Lachnospiraceae bacterium]|nr:iron-containing alcohol dehydrogenase family protein [Lachnospiraceae bacterium]
MTNYSIIIPSYTVGPEAYKEVPRRCAHCGKNAVVIGGQKAMAAAKEKLLAAVADSPLTITDFLLYGTEAAYECAAVLEENPVVQAADMIFAVGGGKATDTAKLVALHLDKPYFTFPTIASNCAASSSVAIIYNPDGTFREFVHFLDSAGHVFVDTDIIAHAPCEYLWAGIGDTYAKYYEVSISARDETLEHFLAMGVTMSRMCLEPLVNFGEKAIADNRAGIASYELEQCALTIIITTGWVSMLVTRRHNMLYNGGVAHALFYALCNLPGFDETHIHGVVVGFGCLLQLVIDGDEEEYNRLRDFNKRIGLPVTFTEIGITLDQLESVLDSLLADEDVEHYPYQLTKEMIMKAAARLV